MSDFQETLDELFNEKLNFEYDGTPLPTPEIDGNENIINYTKEYTGFQTSVLLVECNDRIIEFQKKFIKNQKILFPNAHFLFVSNSGKVFDLYNDASSKQLKKITYDVIGRNTRLFKEKLQLFDVTQAKDSTELQINAEKAFDTSDKLTKKFFDKFKKIHEKLQKAITGIDDEKDKSWYASVMMNRIMFIYFLQKHYVIQGKTSFLLDKFEEVTANGKDYYKDFLLPLFFYGFARRDNNPNKIEFVKQYGPIKYLNGGLFYAHHLEKKYTLDTATATVNEESALQTKIGIVAQLIKEILEFLDGYTWYLDNRPMKEDTDINPDVLGYIFEKYINQKELGAYYTKEDITEYISKNTIIPFILDKMKRNGFNPPDPNPMITNNEDIIAQMNTYVENITSYKEVKFLYKDVLLELSVLDPSVGSGAFLFAALNILLPIYQKAVFKMKEFAKTENDEWLHETILTLSHHAEEYYLTKQIILNNLYGVDIVEEATEICKLRLFLQLASHLPDITSIEPLPDIDFNIYAGNSLVGGLSWEDLEANYTMDLFTSVNRENIKEDIKTLSNFKTQYRIIQQNDDSEKDIVHLKNEIETFKNRINRDTQIEIENPFHWFINFDTIINKGGFDVIIGNPPYVEYTKKNPTTKKSIKDNYQIKSYKTEDCGNLHAYFYERSISILNSFGNVGLIIPLSIISTPRMESAIKIIKKSNFNYFISSFECRPGKLFDGADVRLSILIGLNSEINYINTTNLIKFYSEERVNLFKSLRYVSINDFIKKNKLIPKVQNDMDLSIYNKLYNLSNKISDCISETETNNKLYYSYGFRYWAKILISPTFFKSEKAEKSTGEKELSIKNNVDNYLIGSLLSSSLFYWYYVVTSDAHNFTKHIIYDFPIKIFKSEKLEKAFKEYQISLEENSIRKIVNFKTTGLIEYQEYYVKKSKNLIDKLDEIIGLEIGLTKSEIDYVKNYDIKFRLGEQE